MHILFKNKIKIITTYSEKVVIIAFYCAKSNAFNYLVKTNARENIIQAFSFFFFKRIIYALNRLYAIYNRCRTCTMRGSRTFPRGRGSGPPPPDTPLDPRTKESFFEYYLGIES